MFVKKPNFIWWRGSEVGNNLKFQKNCASYSATGHLDNKKFSGMIKTDAIAGCASIMKTERLKKIGLSDPDFFYGEEDIELSYRLAESKESLQLLKSDDGKTNDDTPFTPEVLAILERPSGAVSKFLKKARVPNSSAIKVKKQLQTFQLDDIPKESPF